LITRETGRELVPQERGGTEKQEKECGQKIKTPENRHGCHESPPGEFDRLFSCVTVTPYQFFGVQRLLNGVDDTGCRFENVGN
jgi:hypothetical protein